MHAFTTIMFTFRNIFFHFEADLFIEIYINYDLNYHHEMHVSILCMYVVIVCHKLLSVYVYIIGGTKFWLISYLKCYFQHKLQLMSCVNVYELFVHYSKRPCWKKGCSQQTALCTLAYPS